MFYILSYSLVFLSSLIPLLLPIGRSLEYEYTFLALFSLYLLFTSSAFFVPKQKAEETLKLSSKEPFKFFSTLFLGKPLFFLLVPGTLFLLKLCPCSHWHFLKWFLLNLYPGFLFSHLSFYLILSGRVKKRKLLVGAPFLLFFFSLTLSLLFFYIFPQKRQTHLLFGHLHGPIYDFFIQTDSGIYLARASHFFFATALLFFFHKRKVFASLSLFFFLIFYGFSLKFPSVQLGISNLEKSFTEKVLKEDFSLFYNKKNLNEARFEKLLKEINFHISEISSLLELKDPPHVRIFFYDNPKQKKLLFGGGQTDVTDIYTPSIHLSSKEFPHRTLRHELVHALLSREAPFNLGFHPNMAITEGIAVALAPEEREGSLHRGAAHLMAYGKISHIKELFSPFFWKYSGARAYTIAGSLLKYLLEEKGLDHARKIYNSLSLEKALGEDTEKILEDWALHIKKDYQPARDDLISEKRYRYPGLFGDSCPHTKAEFFSYGDTLRGKNYLQWRRCLDPKDSYFFIQELKEKLYNGKIKSEKAFTISLKSSLESLEEFKSNKENNYDFYELELLKSDFEYLLGNKEKSGLILEKLQKAFENEILGAYLGRQILARRELEKALPREETQPWRLYLMGFSELPPDTPKEAWITNYLLSLRQENSVDNKEKKPVDWLFYFEENKVPSVFIKNWLKILALKSFSKGHYIDSKFFWKELSKISEGSKKELYEQYARMCHHSQ